jgi:hypothetical protein
MLVGSDASGWNVVLVTVIGVVLTGFAGAAKCMADGWSPLALARDPESVPDAGAPPAADSAGLEVAVLLSGAPEEQAVALTAITIARVAIRRTDLPMAIVSSFLSPFSSLGARQRPAPPIGA